MCPYTPGPEANINVITSALPAGAATETTLATIAGSIAGGHSQVDVLSAPSTVVTATNLDIRDLTSTDIVTVTGGAGQTADVKITLDSEPVTVTGSVTANAGTNLNTSALVTEATMAKQLAFNAVTTIMYVDEPNAATTYQGWAPAGTATAAANWMIRRIATAGTVTSVLWCDGNQNYDNIWDNRAGLAYS